MIDLFLFFPTECSASGELCHDWRSSSGGLQRDLGRHPWPGFLYLYHGLFIVLLRFVLDNNNDDSRDDDDKDDSCGDHNNDSRDYDCHDDYSNNDNDVHNDNDDHDIELIMVMMIIIITVLFL